MNVFLIWRKIMIDNIEVIQECFEADDAEFDYGTYKNNYSYYKIGYDLNGEDDFYTLIVCAYGGSYDGNVYRPIEHVEVANLNELDEEFYINEKTNVNKEYHQQIIDKSMDLLNKTLKEKMIFLSKNPF